MKRLSSFVLFSFIPFFFFTAALQSQDTNIVKYLPLKVGNVWVYNYTWVSTHQVRIRVTGSTISNGHVYYSLEQNGAPCVCSWTSYSPFLVNLNNPIRIDSMTGNIFWKSTTSCGWHNEEYLFDSLKMAPSTYAVNSCFSTGCGDTNNFSVFGNTYPSKLAGQYYIPNYSTTRRYAKGIGLVVSGMGCAFSTYCSYLLQGCVLNGIVYGDTGFVVGVNEISSEVPESFSLSQNYPNPFNPTTHFGFRIADFGLVKLVIFDIQGREISTLVNEELSPGTYEVEWDGTEYPSGVYYYQLTVSSEQLTESFTQTKRMVLIK